MGLYDFIDQRQPDRILNRLKRLDANIPRLKGGRLISTRMPANVSRLRELQQAKVYQCELARTKALKDKEHVRTTGDGDSAG